MNKLKPENVMRALECHSLADISTCDDCPYCDISEQGNCGCDMARDALALLREKDAEIERLYKGIEELAEESDARDIDDTYARQKIRDEAITEFAERVVGRFNICDKAKYPQTVVHDVVARIAKEMKEENES